MRTVVDLGGIASAVVIDRRADRGIRARIRDNAPHAHYALEREDIRAELSAFRTVCEIIGPQPSWSVWEPFGGSGWHTALLQAIVRPVQHIASDRDQDCLDSIMAAHPKVEARLEDSFKAMALRVLGAVDWIHADFNLWTLDHLTDNRDLRRAFHGLFQSAKRMITFTDTTPYTLDGENPGRWYDELRQWIRALFGWSLIRTVEWGPAAMHTIVPGVNPTYNRLGPFPPMEVRVISQSE